jgi:hypothetical protein
MGRGLKKITFYLAPTEEAIELMGKSKESGRLHRVNGWPRRQIWAVRFVAIDAAHLLRNRASEKVSWSLTKWLKQNFAIRSTTDVR